MLTYYSQTLKRAERQYCVTRKELLAVVKGTHQFHVYLYGHHFTIRTDHAALKWLLNFRYPEGQVARWLQQLKEYDFEIQHHPGKSHSNADTLSRRPCLSQSCRHCDRMESKGHTALQIDQTSDTVKESSMRSGAIVPDCSMCQLSVWTLSHPYNKEDSWNLQLKCRQHKNKTQTLARC